MKRIATIMMTTAVIASLVSCKKATDEGGMNIWMSNSPGDYNKMEVEVRSFDIHYEDENIGSSGWMRIATYAGTCDLMQLNNTTGKQMSADRHLPLGKINRMRMVLGENGSIITKDGDTAIVHIPAEVQKGVEVVLNCEASTRYNLDIQLDFNPAKSISKSEDAFYTMQPVLQLRRMGTH